MPENVTAQRKITFKTGLPLGRHATFTHEGELWMAYPAKKSARLQACTDRLIGALASIQRQMIAWLAAHPEDADRVGMLLGTIARAHAMRTELTADKVKAATA